MSPATPAAPLFSSAQPPLSTEPFAQIARLAEGLDSAGLWWLSGYAAGLARAQGGLPAAPSQPVANTEAVAGERLTIVYGSQTGNAKRVAEALAAKLEAESLPVRLLRADAYPTREIRDERYLAIVVSTQGDGDPPDDARALVEFLDGKRAPKLPQLRFAVLGLGDSSYPQFCAIGQRIDARLEALGAQRWIARGDADLDVETVATPWSTQLFGEAKEALKPRQNAPLATVTPLRPHAAPVAWTREKPFQAELLANQRITGRGSEKTSDTSNSRSKAAVWTTNQATRSA